MKKAIVSTFFMLIALSLSITAQQDVDNAPNSITVDRAPQVMQLALLTGHTDAVQGVAFTPDSETLISVGDDTSLRVWQVASGGEIETRFDHISFVKDVAVWPPTANTTDSVRVASVGWGRALVLHSLPLDSPNAISMTRAVEGFTAVLDNVAWSPDGTQVALTIGTGTLALLDAETLDEIARYALPSLQMNALAFSPAGDLLAAASGFPNTDVYVFDLNADVTQPAYLLSGAVDAGAVNAMAFLPGSATAAPHLVSLDDTGTVSLWRVDADATTAAASIRVEDSWFLSLVLHPAGDLLATGDLSGNLRLWEVDTSADTITEVAAFSIGENTPINALAFSPDGSLIAAAGDDGVIYLWGLPLEE